MKKIVLATGNQGKVKELQALLSGKGFDIVPQSNFNVSDVAETGTTFVENAIIKARHAAKETGLPAIADDSGLEIDALNGAPGVYSARFAGKSANDTANLEKVLSLMASVPEENRQARFHCVLVYMSHENDPTPIICHGVWEGRISDLAIGSDGFGYDPIFWLNDLNKSAAQLSKEEKNTMSHRGQALAKLVELL